MKTIFKLLVVLLYLWHLVICIVGYSIIFIACLVFMLSPANPFYLFKEISVSLGRPTIHDLKTVLRSIEG